MTLLGPGPGKATVALVNASDDTVAMVQGMLSSLDIQCLAGCRFADVKNGYVNFPEFLVEHDPQVVIFDISPPYAENWELFKTLRDAPGMEKRSVVLTTTNKNRLDEAARENSMAIEVVGKPDDLQQITLAIAEGLRTADVAAR